MSRDFTTKPRPDQPGRCPSIDPHDTLQCTRAIHDDDQCRAGGIAWRKGSPRIEWDRERADRLQEDVERLRGWIDRSERQEARARRAEAEVARLTAERDALQKREEYLVNEVEWWKERFPCDGPCSDAPEEACSRHGRSPADLWRIIGEVTAERDALTAQVARVEEVLDHWRTVDEGNAAYAERIGERSRFADGLASRADMLRDALAGSESDTGAEEAGHRCEPYYSRAECGQCGWQEQWCVTCSRQMCGCATDAMGADQ